MLLTGKAYLDSMRDGRVIYIGKERVSDVTAHPAFRNAARTVASLYDFKADAANTDLWYEEGGERYSMHFLRARSREDLLRRMRAHRRIADHTLGMFGRSPDHVPSYVTGMTMAPGIFDANRQGFAANLLGYWEHARKRDLYLSYAVIQPQSLRDPKLSQRAGADAPTLRVVREDDAGVVVSGMKMIATAGAFSHDIWIGNILPLAPARLAESITFALPVNAPGVSLWSRRPIEQRVVDQFESPLAWRFDETDCMVLCDEVRVPWERVFIHMDAEASRDIYIRTPAHAFNNHQSCVRFWSKLGFILGLASRVTQATGADRVPAVQETMGRLASYEAILGGMVHGQIQDCEDWPGGWVAYNRRYVYATISWCIDNHSAIIDTLRELCGAGIFQMPGSTSVLEDAALKARFEAYWGSPQMDAVARLKLFNLAWDLIGSDFAGRHQSYEKFYLGPGYIVRNHNVREAPWAQFHRRVDEFLDSYGPPPAA
ncbi:MAG: 4-hydroxyphenylacetate 3-hydroxylase family protein [Vicinamibacterales bacterium]